MQCRICGNLRDNIMHVFREVMFGTGERFDYIECGQCGTFQIREIPDLSGYYPGRYCSFAEPSAFDPRLSWARRLAIRSAAKHYLRGWNLPGKIVASLRPQLACQFPASLREDLLGLTLGSRILDVGCGAGQLLQVLRNFGFGHLMGVDPFVEDDIRHPAGIDIRKCEIEGVKGTFDLIMFHHSLEHVADPLSALKEAHRLLAGGKYCLVRIPIVADAWEVYRENWVQLDAPRHIFLFTEHGFKVVAAMAGFTVARVVYDSTAFQFWGSEQVLRGEPVQDGMVGGDEYLRKVFGDRMEGWDREAIRLNSIGRGDQACFYLQRSQASAI